MNVTVDKDIPILIVDDQKDMRKVVRSTLKQLGFKNVEEATDGAMAFEMLKEKEFKMVMSDWNMKPMSGIELLKEIRADDDLKAMPFIMVTSENKTENILMAKKAGVDNYIIKPINTAVLKEKLTVTLGPIQ